MIMITTMMINTNSDIELLLLSPLFEVCDPDSCFGVPYVVTRKPLKFRPKWDLNPVSSAMLVLWCTS